MLTNLENFSWIIILPVFVLLFAVIWNALKKHSCFSESVSFIIALCVSMLCVVSVIGYLPQEHENSQGITVACKEGASSQEHQQHKFHYILLPYMALMMSFLLLLMLVKIGLLADGVDSIYRPSYGKKDDVTTTDRQKEKHHITQRSVPFSNDLKKRSHAKNSNQLRR